MRRVVLFWFTSMLVMLGCGASSQVRTQVEQPQPAPAQEASAPVLAPTATGVATVAPTPAPAPENTTIWVRYPTDQVIAIRGSGGGLSWDTNTAAVRIDSETWQLDLVLSPQQTIEWKPVIVSGGHDIVWSKGKNYPLTTGEQRLVTPRFFTDNGQIVYLLHAEPENVSARDVWAYLPASYEENPFINYPVLFMHDGQNCFDSGSQFMGQSWRVEEALNQAGFDATVRDIIVVFVANAPSRMLDYTPSHDAGFPYSSTGGADAYLDWLANELVPIVDERFRTIRWPESRGLAGSSLGGLVTAYAGVNYFDTFGVLGIFSPSTWWDERFIIDTVKNEMLAAPNRPLRVYVDSGDDGRVDTADLALEYSLLGYGDALQYVYEKGGRHNEAAWARRFPGAAAFLFGSRDGDFSGSR